MTKQAPKSLYGRHDIRIYEVPLGKDYFYYQGEIGKIEHSLGLEGRKELATSAWAVKDEICHHHVNQCQGHSWQGLCAAAQTLDWEVYASHHRTSTVHHVPGP